MIYFMLFRTFTSNFTIVSYDKGETGLTFKNVFSRQESKKSRALFRYTFYI
jgi:hypothetical protein